MMNETEVRARTTETTESLPAVAQSVRTNYMGQPLVDFGSDEVRGADIVWLFDFPREPVAVTPTGAGRFMNRYAEERIFRALQAGELQPYAVNPDTPDDVTGMTFPQVRVILKDWFFKVADVVRWRDACVPRWPVRTEVLEQLHQKAAELEVAANVPAVAGPGKAELEIGDLAIADLPPLLAMAVETWRNWWREKHPDGWPTNEEVEAWLRDQQVEGRAVSGREAKAICLIAKPPQAKRGR